MNKNIHDTIFHNSSQIKTTHRFFYRRADKHILAYSLITILLSIKTNNTQQRGWTCKKSNLNLKNILYSLVLDSLIKTIYYIPSYNLQKSPYFTSPSNSYFSNTVYLSKLVCMCKSVSVCFWVFLCVFNLIMKSDSTHCSKTLYLKCVYN